MKYFQLLIEILTVYKNSRKTGRVECHNNDEFEYSMRLIKRFDLKYISYVKKSKDNKKIIYIYFSKNEKIVQKLYYYHHDPTASLVHDFRDLNEIIGKLYKYPTCCINIFINNQKEVIQDNDNAILLKTLHNSKSKIFNICMNRFSKYTPIFHLPHSFDCKKSIKIGKNNLRPQEIHGL